MTAIKPSSHVRLARRGIDVLAANAESLATLALLVCDDCQSCEPSVDEAMHPKFAP